MKKFFIFFGGLVVLSSLCSSEFLYDARSAALTRKICNQIGKHINKKYGLQFVGFTEQEPDGKYKIIGIELGCYRILTKDEGRVLLLHCANDSLAAFNSHPEFKSCMGNVPFTNDNIKINIYTQTPESFSVYYPDISGFSFYSNKLWYYTDLPELKHKFYTEECETYEEALKIIEAQQRGDRPFIQNKIALKRRHHF